MTNEEHGMEFLEYVAKNQERLKKNLRKNITYNEDYFDDVYQNTILKVHSRIMKGERIKDFEQYFFIASKYEYINEDNRQKKRLKNDDRDFLYRISHGYDVDCDSSEARRYHDILLDEDNGWKEREQKNERINRLFKYLSERLNESFLPSETDIFLIYYRLKSEKAGVSYKKLAKITGRSFSEISQIIQRIKKYIRENDEINEMKGKLLNGDDD